MSKNISLLEVIVLSTIVVCIVIMYAPLLKKDNPEFQGLEDNPQRELRKITD